jgi:hypothetical protein
MFQMIGLILLQILMWPWIKASTDRDTEKREAEAEERSKEFFRQLRLNGGMFKNFPPKAPVVPKEPFKVSDLKVMKEPVIALALGIILCTALSQI